MKELKYFHAVECTCDKTGLSGNFIIDQEYYKETIYQLFFNSVFLEIYDNDDTQEIEFSYSENWN